MTRARLDELERRGWRLTRDGSTATTFLARDDPEEPDAGWELLVLHTAGHGARWTLAADDGALSERSAPAARALAAALFDAIELLEGWSGELPAEPPGAVAE